MLELSIEKRVGDFGLGTALRVGNELMVLFGPSGAGKSLTLQAIAGLLQPDDGRIAIDGRVVFDKKRGLCLAPQYRRVGYVPQGYGLFPHLSVAENIGYGLYAVARDEARRRVSDIMAQMRLQGLAERRPRQLSGGQQQRVALARALVVEPEILLLDEPFGALDSAIRSRLRQDLLDLTRRFGGTTLFVTHDLAEAYMLGDRIAVLDRGEVLQEGTREDVFYRPRRRAVARFMGAKNIFNGIVVDRGPGRVRVAIDGLDGITLIAPEYDVVAGEAVELCIRPDDIMLIAPDRPAGGAVRENQVRGRVVAEIAQGTGFILYFKLGAAPGGYHDYDLEIHLPRHAHERLELATRRDWMVSLKRGAIHVIGKEMA